MHYFTPLIHPRIIKRIKFSPILNDIFIYLFCIPCMQNNQIDVIIVTFKFATISLNSP